MEREGEDKVQRRQGAAGLRVRGAKTQAGGGKERKREREKARTKCSDDKVQRGYTFRVQNRRQGEEMKRTGIEREGETTM